MSSVKNCGKSSATKTVKGFTLIELLIVIAIIAILAGISSVLIQGFVRDARLETANNKAQQVYSAVQNTLIQFEITQDYTPIDADVLDGTSTTETAKYIILEFEMKDGELNGSDVTVTNVTSSNNSFTYNSSNNYPSAATATTDEGKAFAKLAKYLCGSLAADFNGYSYVCIDMDNYVVDSVLFTEDARVKNSTNGVLDFANTYTKGYTYDTPVVGCDSIFDQKTKYKGKDNSYLDAAGVVIGYYPMMDDLPDGTFT